MRQKKIYIAGPMTGYPEFNFPAFYAAEQRLRERGWIVFNPANKKDEAALDKEAFKTGDAKEAVAKGFDFRKAFLWDVSKVIEGDAIYMLNGWAGSAGAKAEHAVAEAMKKHYPHYEILYESIEVELPYAA